MSSWSCCSINANDVLPRTKGVFQPQLRSGKKGNTTPKRRGQLSPLNRYQLPSASPTTPPARLGNYFSRGISSLHSLSSINESFNEHSSLSIVKFRPSAFNDLSESVICFNQTNYQIVFANKSAHKMFGSTICVGKHFQLIFPKIDVNALTAIEDTPAQAVRNNQLFSVRYSLTPALTQKKEKIWLQTIRAINAKTTQPYQIRKPTNIVQQKILGSLERTESFIEQQEFNFFKSSSNVDPSKENKTEEKHFIRNTDSFQGMPKRLPSFESRTRRDRTGTQKQEISQSEAFDSQMSVLDLMPRNPQFCYRVIKLDPLSCFANKNKIGNWRIIVAEDEGVTRNITIQKMKQLGFQYITCAKDGNELVQAYKKSSTEIPIDLIVTDIEMPNKSGTEAVREIRKLEQGTKTRAFIVICSGKENAQKESDAAGADAFLEKPLLVKTLKEFILLRVKS